MPLTLTLANFIDIITLLGVLGAIFVIFRDQHRSSTKAAEREGLHQATIAEIRRDLTALTDRVATIEREARQTEGSVIELKADMKHVLEGLKRIEDKLDQKVAS